MDDDRVGRLELPASSTSPGAARRFVSQLATDCRLRSPVGDLAVIVSELVTNAIEHGTGPVEVLVRWWDEGLCVEVSSALTSGRPVRLHPAATTPAGRGLSLVETLSQSWGHTDAGQRRTVWAQVS
jgi:anti-sigma regulatory factor (Ser/Thr protein kinase)